MGRPNLSRNCPGVPGRDVLAGGRAEHVPRDGGRLANGGGTGRHGDADGTLSGPRLRLHARLTTGLTCSASNRSKSPAAAPHARMLPVRSTSIRTVKLGRPRLAIMQAVIPGRERATRPGSAPMPGFRPAAPRTCPALLPAADQNPHVQHGSLWSARQAGAILARWATATRTPDDWTVEVVQVAAGDRLCIPPLVQFVGAAGFEPATPRL